MNKDIEKYIKNHFKIITVDELSPEEYNQLKKNRHFPKDKWVIDKRKKKYIPKENEDINKLRNIIREEIQKLNENTYQVSEPLLVMFEKIDPRGKVYEKKAAKFKDKNEFAKQMKKFKEKIKYKQESENDIIQIRVIKGKIGTLTKEQENFLQTMAWSMGDHYELFY